MSPEFWLTRLAIVLQSVLAHYGLSAGADPLSQTDSMWPAKGQER